VWGTGFVGQMVIAEIIKHPLFELVGVGVSNPEKVGRDVGEICGLGAAVGVRATDDIEALIALKPDALVHYGPTAAHADVNIDVIANAVGTYAHDLRSLTRPVKPVPSTGTPGSGGGLHDGHGHEVRE
ncbi:hypothetical protein RM705_36805, partial [Streptomyces sp. DSM 41636]|nr:hypothetical protein [Streptomyces sp. DSM 41636]